MLSDQPNPMHASHWIGCCIGQWSKKKAGLLFIWRNRMIAKGRVAESELRFPHHQRWNPLPPQCLPHLSPQQHSGQGLAKPPR